MLISSRVHALLDVMAAKRPYSVISRSMHIHPTISELVPTRLQQLKPLSRTTALFWLRPSRSVPREAVLPPMGDATEAA